MTYSKEQQQEHINQIRRILVIKPDSSIRDIRDTLERQREPLKLNKDYINKLVNKIRKERAKRLDHYTVNKILAEFQDEIKELKRRLWIIITNPDIDSTEKDKIAAVRELRTSSKDLFDKMFDAGVFKRKLGELEIGKKLSKEEQDLINRIIKLNYGKKPKPETKPDTKPEGTTGRGKKSEGSPSDGGKNKQE